MARGRWALIWDGSAPRHHLLCPLCSTSWASPTSVRELSRHSMRPYLANRWCHRSAARAKRSEEKMQTSLCLRVPFTLMNPRAACQGNRRRRMRSLTTQVLSYGLCTITLVSLIIGRTCPRRSAHSMLAEFQRLCLSGSALGGFPRFRLRMLGDHHSARRQQRLRSTSLNHGLRVSGPRQLGRCTLTRTRHMYSSSLTASHTERPWPCPPLAVSLGRLCHSKLETPPSWH